MAPPSQPYSEGDLGSWENSYKAKRTAARPYKNPRFNTNTGAEEDSVLYDVLHYCGSASRQSSPTGNPSPLSSKTPEFPSHTTHHHFQKMQARIKKQEITKKDNATSHYNTTIRIDHR